MSPDEMEPVLDRLRSDPDVEYAEPDRILQPLLTPNDPEYPKQWHYHVPTSSLGAANLPGAWDITAGDTSVVTAVIDTGWLDHQELAVSSVAGYCFITDADRANSPACTPGLAVSDPDDPGDWVSEGEANDCPDGPFCGCGPAGSSWHGTHVAGTIGAASDNGVGVAGISWHSRIQPIRVLGKCGGFMSDIIDGMRWAAGLAVTGYPANSTPAKVLNMSLGGVGSCSRAMQDAVNEVTAAGAVVVVSAGNSNVNLTFTPFEPASCGGVITVAAVGPRGERAAYSNYGTAVELAAPGGNDWDRTADAKEVLSTLNGGAEGPVGVGGAGDIYEYYQGTSMAAPHVSGVAALMFSVNPALTPAQVLAALQGSARPFPAGSGCSRSSCGAGLLDAAGAVTAALPAAPTGLRAAALGVSSVTWTWNPSGAARYAFQPSTGGAPINLTGTSVTLVALSTNTAYGAAVASSVTVQGVLSSFVTGYTLAAPATSFALAAVHSSSMTVSWAANTNPPAVTSYRVDAWQAGGATVSFTAAGSPAVLTGLFGGGTYYLSVAALNGDGVATRSVVLTTVTWPGGAAVVGPAGGTVVSGPAVLRIPPGAYAGSVEVRLQTAVSLACGASPFAGLAPTGVGLDVALDPAVEPALPVLLTVSYRNAVLGGADLRKLAIARCDTVRNAWVILPSTIDEANGTVTAASGHLSVFQIMQAEPPADAFHFRVGPNPLRAARGQRQMNFLGPAGAEVRIYTLLGELVKDLALAANGTASWDASNRAGQPVASGVYFVHVSADGQSRTYKVMVER